MSEIKTKSSSVCVVSSTLLEQAPNVAEYHTHYLVHLCAGRLPRTVASSRSCMRTNQRCSVDSTTTTTTNAASASRPRPLISRRHSHSPNHRLRNPTGIGIDSAEARSGRTADAQRSSSAGETTHAHAPLQPVDIEHTGANSSADRTTARSSSSCHCDSMNESSQSWTAPTARRSP